MDDYKKILKSPKFAYLIGAFMADGCFYIKNKKYFTFEFYDGTSVKSELKYSLKHIIKIKSILNLYFKKNLEEWNLPFRPFKY